MLHPTKGSPTDTKRLARLNQILSTNNDWVFHEKGMIFYEKDALFPLMEEDKDKNPEPSSSYKLKIGEDGSLNVTYHGVSDSADYSGPLNKAFYWRFQQNGASLGYNPEAKKRQEQLKLLSDQLFSRLADAELQELQDKEPKFSKRFNWIVGSLAVLLFPLVIIGALLIGAMSGFGGPARFLDNFHPKDSLFKKMYGITEDPKAKKQKDNLFAQWSEGLEGSPDAGANTLGGEYGSRPDVNLSNLRRSKSPGDISSESGSTLLQRPKGDFEIPSFKKS